MKLLKAILMCLLVTLLIVAVVGLIWGAITGSVFGLFEYSLITGFFAGVTAEQLLTYLGVGIVAIVPNLGPTLFNWLKETFGLEGDAAHYFVIALSFLITSIALFVTGSLKLDGLTLTFNNLFAIAGEIYLLSQISYKKWLQPKTD